eukprot:tig00020614_g12186.t1
MSRSVLDFLNDIVRNPPANPHAQEDDEQPAAPAASAAPANPYELEESEEGSIPVLSVPAIPGPPDPRAKYAGIIQLQRTALRTAEGATPGTCTSAGASSEGAVSSSSGAVAPAPQQTARYWETVIGLDDRADCVRDLEEEAKAEKPAPAPRPRPAPAQVTRSARDAVQWTKAPRRFTGLVAKAPYPVIPPDPAAKSKVPTRVRQHALDKFFEYEVTLVEMTEPAATPEALRKAAETAVEREVDLFTHVPTANAYRNRFAHEFKRLLAAGGALVRIFGIDDDEGEEDEATPGGRAASSSASGAAAPRPAPASSTGKRPQGSPAGPSSLPQPNPKKPQGSAPAAAARRGARAPQNSNPKAGAPPAASQQPKPSIFDIAMQTPADFLAAPKPKLK